MVPLNCLVRLTVRNIAVSLRFTQLDSRITSPLVSYGPLLQPNKVTQEKHFETAEVVNYFTTKPLSHDS